MRSYEILILLFLFFIPEVTAQEGTDSLKNFRDNAYLTYNIGYAFNSLKDAKNNIREIVNFYRNEEINLPVQTLYPYSSMVGGSFGICVYRNLYVGMEYYNTKTKAFGLYSDKAGDIDVFSTISSYKLGVTCKFIISKYEYGIFSPFVEGSAGQITIDYDLSDNYKLNPPFDEIQTTKITAKGKSIFADFRVGLNQKVINFIFFEKIGYHYGAIREMDGSLEINGTAVGNGKLTTEINMSGFTFEIGVGLRL